MRVWLLTIGEPLPSDSGQPRLLRTGILADVLTEQGEEVVWWTSTFDHVHKKQRSLIGVSEKIQSNLDIRFIYGPSYSKNISLRRLRNHICLAKSFRKLARLEKKHPDLILCSWPLVELCIEAIQYGKSNGIPVVIDVRDMWPNAIVDLIPKAIRPFAQFCLSNWYREARIAAKGADSIIGITEPIVTWATALAQRSPNANDKVFPMGYRQSRVPLDEATVADKQWDKLGIPNKDSYFIVCFFGTLGRHFELETVVNAAHKLHSTHPKIKFVICGDGPHGIRWKRAAENLDNLFVPGWVNAAQIQSLMRRAAVGLAPYVSSWDFKLSIPNKPIEYLSAGLPVISSLKGTLADLLSTADSGITYSNGDANDLVRTLRFCYEHPALVHRMSKNALELFESQFIAEVVYKRMANHLRSLVR